MKFEKPTIYRIGPMTDSSLGGGRSGMGMCKNTYTLKLEKKKEK